MTFIKSSSAKPPQYTTEKGRVIMRIADKVERERIKSTLGLSKKIIKQTHDVKGGLLKDS